MNTDRVLVVFGSALTSDSPRDIDVACEGEFSEHERSLALAWMRMRGLPMDLPLDVHTCRPWRGCHDDRRAELTLPTFHSERNEHAVLRGDADVSWHQYDALPARIRSAEGVDHLLAILGDCPSHIDGRMAVLIDSSTQDVRDFGAYTQGRLALRNAIAKCPFWAAAELRDDRVRFVRMLAEYGVCSGVEREVREGGQAGGAGAGVNWVRLDGIQLSYGRLIPWVEALAHVL